MITQVTFGVFVERIKRYLSNGWPDIADNYTSNEILLYVYEALATAITTSAKESYKVDGIYSTYEGFITTFSFAASAFTRDAKTGYFKVTLPAPPVGLPLGYSIKAPTFVGDGAESYPLIFLQSFNRANALKMPTPNFGIYCWPENRTLFLYANGQNLMALPQTLNVPMLTARGATGSDTDVINAPDDDIEMAFKIVIDNITGRVDRPKTLTNAGNTVPTAK